MRTFDSRMLASASAAVIATFAVATAASAQQVPAVTAPEAQDCAALPTEAEREVCSKAQAQGDAPSGVAGDDPAASAEEAALPDATGAVATEGEAIVVTGSRIKQNTYNSISPLQVVTTESMQNVGLFDPAQILQRDESASGTQIDATFQGFVLNNGPGSQTVDLRGLGADRTLLLVNGRRLAPAGVEGAPTNPSINLLPSSLIERYDLLLEGASSVYGSDAIAGVGNVILRKNFKGLELFASGNYNGHGNGDDYTLSAAWGKKFDRGFIGVGAEYNFRDSFSLKDRPFFADCETHLEVTNTGEIRRVDLATNAAVQNADPNQSVSESQCKITSNGGRVNFANTRFGSLYFRGGGGNSTIPFFSETNYFNGRNVDANGDGLRDVDLQFQNANNGYDSDHDFIPEQKLYNVMAYGEYEITPDITPYFEANYSRAEIFSDRNTGFLQLFPMVPATNPFNPCFRAQPNGVDCRAADNAFQFAGPTPRPATALSTGFDLAVQPIFAIKGDRNNLDVTQEQYRFVGGLKGNLPFIGDSWTYDVAGVYSRAKGKSRRLGIREDKLAFALGIDPTGDFNGDGVFDNNGDGIADDYDLNLQTGGIFGGPILGPATAVTPCNAAALDNPGAAMPDLTAGCVPVNLFAPSVLGSPIGDFATQAERDYLFGVRDFSTVYEQTMFSAYATGDIITLPYGDLGTVVGVEWRRDKIKSLPDDIASNGLFWGFFSDQGAVGSKDIKEAFAELDIPIVKDAGTLLHDLRLNVSGRVTDEEFYGTNYTYAIKGGWRPVKPLLLKASYGTSFRAPNLRENFLLGQSGFNTITDPCAVPNAAFVSGAYVAALDTREATTLQNCIREGRDPTVVGIEQSGLNTIQQGSAEIVSGGSLELDPETSRSFTAGAAFAETFGNGFNVSLGVNYYNIKLKDSIIEPSAQFIVNDCFNRDDGQRSPFCDRIGYGATPASRFLVSDVFAGFLNLDQEKVRGLDLNGFVGKEVHAFGRRLDLGLNVRANRLIERSSLFVNDDGSETFDEDAGEFGFPKWTGRATFTAEVDKTWLFTWQTRFIGPVEQDPTGIDPLSDAFGRGPNGVTTNVIGDTCYGNGSGTGSGTAFVPNGRVPGDGVFCRDVGFASDYFIHAVSVRYRKERFEARIGITNLFNRDPPEVDGTEVFSISNVPIGNGYDLDGREVFATISYKF